MSKLVRDRIPDRLRAEGLDPVVTVDRSAGPLLRKLREETAELETAVLVNRGEPGQEDAVIEELADLLQVWSDLVDVLCGVASGSTRVAEQASLKRQAKGGFREGFILQGAAQEIPRHSLSIADLHREAMRALDESVELQTGPSTADAALRRSEFLLYRAFILEAEAARLLTPRIGFEPTRGVIHRSAAALAVQCREYAEARRLVAEGLAGNPHPEIAAELREVLADAEAKEQRS